MKIKQLNLAEAKAKLSHLVNQAARGKTVVIAKAGLPVAKLVPINAEPKKIKFGGLAGALSKQAIAALEAPLDQETMDLMNTARCSRPSAHDAVARYQHSFALYVRAPQAIPSRSAQDRGRTGCLCERHFDF